MNKFLYLVGVIKEAFDNYPLNCIGGEHICLVSLSRNDRISLQIITRFYLTSYSAIWDSCVYGKYRRTLCSVVIYSVRTLPSHTGRIAGSMCNRFSRIYFNYLNGLTTAFFWLVTQQAVTQDSAVLICFAVEAWDHTNLKFWFQTLRLHKATYWKTITCSDGEWSENQNSEMCAQMYSYNFFYTHLVQRENVIPKL
jgi:hypothetical protein